MAYKMYIAGVSVPIVPSKVTLKINNQNKTVTLINGEEINVLKSAGLTDISFELLLPQTSYPFTSGIVLSPSVYLALFEKLKTSKEPFQWILYRGKPSGGMFFFTNLKVGLESYEVVDNVENGFDISAKINLTQYRTYGTKTVTITEASSSAETAVATVQAAARETTSAPSAASYTTQTGDTLWNIAKKLLGDGSRYTEIQELNSSLVPNPNSISAGLELTLPS